MHEHDGHCCEQHDERPPEQISQLAEGLGSLCCNGHCHHIEHLAFQQPTEEEYRPAGAAAAPMASEKPKRFTRAEKVTKDKKKKKYSSLLGQLMTAAA
ncbi:MAG TPA: hypothetical protein VG992_04865 [Candidatus Saccharimonadales bacterium]|nr:hypothetical protein [Candidatus Saccharimonadales bacterium]